ncbi:MAG: DUF1080 domain-containing protein [Ruminococcaceae bacterium]|nr:DUF1080 domain-containing protein [Oscillospiraceae bacterium]
MAKIILFDGTNLDMWRKTDGSPAEWELNGDGTMTVVARKGDIMSTVKFKDAHIHVEWMAPDMPDVEHDWKGNSGVYIHGCYEIQILDSYGIEDPTCWDCGGIYEFNAPIKNACRPALEWQTFDIYFRAPRYNEKGERTECARVTIIQNGECIQNNILLHQHTPGGVTEYAVEEGPLMLQDHKTPVRFRNIWIETL